MDKYYEEGFLRKCAEFGIDKYAQSFSVLRRIFNAYRKSSVIGSKQSPVSAVEKVLDRSFPELGAGLARKGYRISAKDPHLYEAKDIIENMDRVSARNSVKSLTGLGDIKAIKDPTKALRALRLRMSLWPPELVVDPRGYGIRGFNKIKDIVARAERLDKSWAPEIQTMPSKARLNRLKEIERLKDEAERANSYW